MLQNLLFNWFQNAKLCLPGLISWNGIQHYNRKYFEPFWNWLETFIKLLHIFHVKEDGIETTLQQVVFILVGPKKTRPVVVKKIEVHSFCHFVISSGVKSQIASTKSASNSFVHLHSVVNQFSNDLSLQYTIEWPFFPKFLWK